MSDTVWSAKTDQDTKDRLRALAAGSGLTDKDFLVRMTDVYEASQARESMSIEQAKDLRDLQHHLDRILEVYIHLTKTGQDRENAAATRVKELEDEIQATKAAVVDAGTQVQAAKMEAAQVREAAEKDVRDIRDVLAQAREAQQQSAKLAVLAEEAAASAKARCAELEDLANQADEYRRDGERAREETAKAKEAMLRANELAGIEREKAVLVAERKAMNEIGKLREDLAQAREEKAALEVSIARASSNPG